MTNTYPALRDANDQLVTDLEGKATLFRQWFFPAEPHPATLQQPTDPPLRQPRTWDAVKPKDITKAIRTTSKTSALGPSGIGYDLLRWAHKAQPNVLL